MDRQQAIEFGTDRLELFGGQMDEFIKVSLDALKEQRPIFNLCDKKSPFILIGKKGDFMTFSYMCAPTELHTHCTTGVDSSMQTLSRQYLPSTIGSRFCHFPPVKSGKATGAPPFAIDSSERAPMASQVAVS